MPIVCASLLMLHGCGKPGKVELAFPFSTETSEIRCPAVDPAVKNEWTRSTARPPAWKERDVTAGDLMAHIDNLEIAEARKNGYGAQQMREYERCRRRGLPTAPAKGTPTS